MSRYNEPTNEAFDAAEQTALDIMETSYPEILTKAGSVVRELLLRPFAYLYAWCRTNLAAYRRQSTVGYLLTSQLTENAVADAVASNYFVTRKQGTHAKGVITVTSSNPVMQFPAGTTFTAGGVQLRTPDRTIATSGVPAGLENGIRYVPVTPVGSNYAANIPVEAVDTGDIELDAGTPVTMDFVYTGIVSAELTSPVTGGSGTETDAQLMRRAEYNTASSGVGSWYGIRKLLNDVPVNVTDFGLVAGEDDMLYRARYNSLNINPGGFVDCYVKTQRQASVGELHGTLEIVQGTFDGVVTTIGKVTFQPDASVAGVMSVDTLVVGSDVIRDYTIEYGSSDATMSAESARLSVKQTVTVYLHTDLEAGAQATAYVRYMPGLPDLQSHLDMYDNKFIGQDIMVKAAVPVAVHLDCTAYSETYITDDRMAAVKAVLVDTVDAMRVGCGSLNFSDLREAVHDAFPDIDLRLPCTMSADVLLMSGGMDAFYSNTGILDITKPVHYDAWSPSVCFFSLIPDNIRIDQL